MSAVLKYWLDSKTETCQCVAFPVTTDCAGLVVETVMVICVEALGWVGISPFLMCLERGGRYLSFYQVLMRINCLSKSKLTGSLELINNYAGKCYGHFIERIFLKTNKVAYFTPS